MGELQTLWKPASLMLKTFRNRVAADGNDRLLGFAIDAIYTGELSASESFDPTSEAAVRSICKVLETKSDIAVEAEKRGISSAPFEAWIDELEQRTRTEPPTALAPGTRKAAPPPSGLSQGDWLMPPASLKELAKRIWGDSNSDRSAKLHTLLDRHGLKNEPADNRQSWTVRLDLMEMGLALKLDPTYTKQK
jgi:hypothetical protein